MSSHTSTGADKPLPTRRWSATNSHQLMKAYDKSPVASPPLSRNNSDTSIQSTQSEPAWKASHDRRDHRRDSNASAQTTSSHKKGGLMGMFSREKKPKEKKDIEKIVLGSRHAAAVKTRMMLDPKYQEFNQRHPRPNVKTAGINQHARSAHSSAAEQEARHPHSGPPAIHASTNVPLLTRIESRDEPDDELDGWERQRREWNETHESDLHDIIEHRSRNNSTKASPWASPIQSRDSSPTRMGLRSRNPSWSGRYHRNQDGRWTAKDVPSMTPIHHHDQRPDALVTSLTERLRAL